MKKAFLTTSIACFVILLFIVGCSKNSTSTSALTATDEAALKTQVSQNAQDQTVIENDNDAIASDATAAAETVPGFDASTTVTGLHGALFGAPSTTDSASYAWFIIDKSPIVKKIKRMIVRYRGLWETGRGVLKQGYITIDLINGTKWTDVGAVIKETDSVSVLYRNGKKRIYQGTRYLTNVSGGYYSLKSPVLTPFIFTMHATGSVTFEDSTVRNYWIARRNTMNKVSPYVFETNGDTTINGSLCTIGGTTRYGNSFLVQSPQAISANLDCGYANPTAGVRINTSKGETVTLTFGTDSTGTQVNSGCAWGYKINWTKLNGQQGTAIISY